MRRAVGVTLAMRTALPTSLGRPVLKCMPLDDSESAGVMPQTVRRRHGSCSCPSHTSSGSSARTRRLAFRVRLVELAEPHRNVAADDDRRPASLDDDTCIPRAWPGAGTSRSPEQLELAVDRHVPHAGRVDPFANGVVGLARVVELPTLDVDRPAGEAVAAAAVVEVQVCVDNEVDAGEIEVLLAQWPEAGSRSATAGCSSVMPVSTSTRASGWLDDVHVDRHPLALGEQVKATKTGVTVIEAGGFISYRPPR